MEQSFWMERWQQGRTAFHQESVNPWLARYGPDLFQNAHRVLVPLCGKTNDLFWLAARSKYVLGIEFVDQAVQAFFAENRLPFERSAEGRYRCLTAFPGQLEIQAGDFFALKPPPRFDALYDRAAMIALPPELRARYVPQVIRLLNPGARMLVVLIEYESNTVSGPPFSVTGAELEASYGHCCRITALGHEEAPAPERLRAAGLSAVREFAYSIEKQFDPADTADEMRA